MIFPSDWLSLRSRDRPSMTKIKRRGESGQPCLKPLPLRKKEEGSPFTKTEKFAVVTPHMIHLMESRLKPDLMRISLRKSQSKQSNAFFRSSLRMRAFDFFVLMLCRHSWVVPMVSKICLPFKKPRCSPQRARKRMGLIRLAIVLVINL